MSSICGFLLKNSVRVCSSVNKIQLINRCAFLSTEAVKKDFGKNKKVSPKITLIAENDSLSIITLDEAQKISKRRDLKLVKILDLDTKTQRAVYKLMSGSEYHSEELKRREEKKQARKDPHIKGEKLLTLTSKISDHDLNSKFSKVETWLRKFYEVRVVINSGEHEAQKADQIVSAIETRTSELGKIVQKRIKDGNVRFQIMPHLKKETDSTPTNTNKPPEKANVLDQQIRSYHTMTVL